jgi:hypothetical protein
MAGAFWRWQDSEFFWHLSFVMNRDRIEKLLDYVRRSREIQQRSQQYQLRAQEIEARVDELLAQADRLEQRALGRIANSRFKLMPETSKGPRYRQVSPLPRKQ